MSHTKKVPIVAQPVDCNERQLIIRCIEGNIAAFEQLIAPYQKQIFNVGLRMLNSYEDAADLTQDTMLKIYRALPSFRGDARFSTWLYRITVNTCQDYLRKSYKQKEIQFSDYTKDEENDRELDVADYSALPEQICLDGEADEYLLALINGLSPKYSLVTVLREISGMSYDEIAHAANISVGTVKSRLNRARAVMRKQVLADAEHNSQLSRLIGQRRDG